MMKNNKRIWNALLSMMLTIAMVFAVAACGESDVPTSEVQTTETVQMAETAQSAEVEVTAVGEGSTKFAFTVVDKDGNATAFEVSTDKETVGEALLDAKLIEGEEGAYGLYVKKVNGIVADYDVDQTYWAFYVDGEYAMSGVDVTKIEEGKTYTFKVEK